MSYLSNGVADGSGTGALANALNVNNDIKGAPVQKNLQADPTAYTSSYEVDYWNKVFPGASLPSITAYLRTAPPDVAQKLTNGALAAISAGLQPDTLAEKVLGQVALAVSVGALTAGFGATAGAALGASIGGTTGTIAAGAATGAAGATARDLLTTGNVALKDVGLGALGGGIGAAAAPLSNAIASNTGLSPGLSSTLVKGGAGALSSALAGGNVLAGAAGGLASGVAGMAGLNPTLAGGIGKLVGAETNNLTSGVAGGMAAIGAAGSLANGSNSMPQNPANLSIGNMGTGLGLGNSLLSTIGGGLGAIGGFQQGNTVGNVLSNTQAGSNVGTNTSYTGPNSTASINAGQVNTGLTGGLGQTNTNLGNLGSQQSNIAGSFNGVAPANVQNSINAQQQNLGRTPQGTQGMLGGQAGMQTAVQGSQFGLIGAGTNALNNPLTTNLQNAAQTQLGTAGQDFTSTYNNSLASLNASLAQPTAQAESQMADAQFGRGQLGTSGGALQTQAFAKGLGQAYLGNQQTAFNEAQNAQNSATANAGSLNAGANANLGTANSLLANAYGQFNNTSQLGTNTANSIFNQNSTISQLGNQYGQTNLQNQVLGNTLPAQLAGQYGANANQAVTGATGLNSIDMSGFNAALGAGTQQGNQYNNAMGNAARIASSGVGTNGLSAIGSALNGISGSNLLGGVGSAFSALTGGGASNSNLNPGNYNAYNAANGPSPSDISNLTGSNIDYSVPDMSTFMPDNSNFDLNFGP